jgi:hypothetical protein
MENKEDALCWSPKKDGSIQFWASMVGKEIDAFWFPANDKIRLEWKLDNGQLRYGKGRVHPWREQRLA